MAAGMIRAGISGREHGSGSKRSLPRTLVAGGLVERLEDLGGFQNEFSHHADSILVGSC